jgi:hypothetical protein
MGTVTFKDVEVPEFTVALVAPKKTILFEYVVLKLVPVMVMFDPVIPDSGLKNVTVVIP